MLSKRFFIPACFSQVPFIAYIKFCFADWKKSFFKKFFGEGGGGGDNYHKSKTVAEYSLK